MIGQHGAGDVRSIYFQTGWSTAVAPPRGEWTMVVGSSTNILHCIAQPDLSVELVVKASSTDEAKAKHDRYSERINREVEID